MNNKDFKIVVLAKQVPDTHNVGKDAMKEDGTINRAALPAIFNPDDLKALEMALACRDAISCNCNDTKSCNCNDTKSCNCRDARCCNCRDARCCVSNVTVTIVTMGPPRASEIIRESMFRGADDGIVISDKRFAGSDTLATSYALSMAVKKLGRIDLVFAGHQAIDGDTAQVGPQVAEKLEIPQVTYAEELISLNENEIVIKRRLERGVEVVKSPLPALVTVHSNANECRPRRAERVIMCKKNQIDEWTADDINPDFERLGMNGSPTKVKSIENVVLTSKENKIINNNEGEISELMKELITTHII